jgi:hypothetical protein
MSAHKRAPTPTFSPENVGFTPEMCRTIFEHGVLSNLQMFSRTLRGVYDNRAGGLSVGFEGSRLERAAETRFYKKVCSSLPADIRCKIESQDWAASRFFHYEHESMKVPMTRAITRAIAQEEDLRRQGCFALALSQYTH